MSERWKLYVQNSHPSLSEMRRAFCLACGLYFVESSKWPQSCILLQNRNRSVSSFMKYTSASGTLFFFSESASL